MKMSQALKEGVLGKLLARYARRDREGKGVMLVELCEDFGNARVVPKTEPKACPKVCLARWWRGSAGVGASCSCVAANADYLSRW